MSAYLSRDIRYILLKFTVKSERKLRRNFVREKVVRVVGIEPTLLSEPDFESGASTSSTTPAHSQALHTQSAALVRRNIVRTTFPSTANPVCFKLFQQNSPAQKIQPLLTDCKTIHNEFRHTLPCEVFRFTHSIKIPHGFGLHYHC